MRRHLVLTAVTCASLVTGPADARADVTSPAPDATASDRVAEYLRDRMDVTDTPGLAYAIVSADEIERTGAFGEDGDGNPVDETTPFLWGSVAKPVTATAVMTLVEDGSIALDEPVQTYLPSFTLADAETSARITVRHLLEQTSGIPEGTGITDRFEHRADPYGEAIVGLADADPLYAPGTKHEYASANYLVLGALVEAVTGATYTEYLREHVVGPLEMDGAITSPDQADEGLPDGHRYVAGQAVGFASPYDETGPSYGYLGGTITDLAHFAQAHLAGGRYDGAELLDAESVTRMHTGTAAISDTHRYALGWRDDDRNADLGTSTIWHGGASPGYQAMVVLLPDIDRGIVVLQNAYGVFQDAELAAAALGAARLLAGGEPGPPTSDVTYPIALGVLTALLVLLTAAIAWSLRRMRSSAARPRARRRIVLGALTWLVGGITLAYVAGIALPRALDTNLSQIPLFAPDVAWLLIAIVVMSLALAVTRLAAGVVSLRHTHLADDRHPAPVHQ